MANSITDTYKMKREILNFPKKFLAQKKLCDLCFAAKQRANIRLTKLTDKLVFVDLFLEMLD